MTNHQKRLRLRQILSLPGGEIALGVTDRFFARLAEDCGYSVIHLAGNGMHKSLILPDRGLVTMTEMAQRAAEITEVCDIPLMVDGETGYGGSDQIVRAVRLFERAGAAAIRFEDSLVGQSGFGVAGKSGVTPIPAMVQKIKTAVDSREDPSLVFVVRCDSRSTESLEQMQQRFVAYVEAGADAVGVLLSDLEDLRYVGSHSPAPLVARWPREKMTVLEFFAMGYKIAQVPSSVALAAVGAVRAMLRELKEKGTEREYFARMTDSEWASRWYAKLGTKPEGTN